jgi:hypothetical protein
MEKGSNFMEKNQEELKKRFIPKIKIAKRLLKSCKNLEMRLFLPQNKFIDKYHGCSKKH